VANTLYLNIIFKTAIGSNKFPKKSCMKLSTKSKLRLLFCLVHVCQEMMHTNWNYLKLI